MANILQTGSAWLQGMRKAHASSDVTYSRGAASVVLKATKCEPETLEEPLETDSIRKVKAVDWKITAADLVLPGIGATSPAAGDTITEVLESGTFVWGALPIDGEPCFRFSDRGNVTFRIHTKLESAS